MITTSSTLELLSRKWYTPFTLVKAVSNSESNTIMLRHTLLQIWTEINMSLMILTRTREFKEKLQREKDAERIDSLDSRRF